MYYHAIYTLHYTLILHYYNTLYTDYYNHARNTFTLVSHLQAAAVRMRTRSKSDRATSTHRTGPIRNTASYVFVPLLYMTTFTPCLTQHTFYQAGTTQLLFDYIK